ncbi:thiamine/thiamine pyrophosphate ABC transporter, permease protein [Fulvimarina endophytica]|uniref:Thiamine transport system permease protein ThiP n=1 Tax=Fulvimarina endophytica TaxID=2293836 RepID=A0A371X3L0_9HYPH|nr:thiamine/thiamine pyrophosphate ABC transporter permease [Fulvimarina endophytica]RFC63789.1 thiamine/thiamine pyrophosphate ABC transporter, permease protein [Fulvimarina endophytica]
MRSRKGGDGIRAAASATSVGDGAKTHAGGGLRLGADTDRLWRLSLGLLAALALAGFVAGGFVLLLAGTGAELPVASILGDGYLRGVVFFTLEQAALSTLISVLAAIPLAAALHRARFRGRTSVLRIFLLPQALPVLVGALAIITVWGRNGVVSDLGAALGLPRFSIYGLEGILLAHAFFNIPLAARLMIAALDAVPRESWRLAGQLSFSPLTTFRLVEWPAIRRALPAAASLVFMLCATSFTIVLVLGGGPGATTLEVAIYQTLRYEFDPGRAVALSLLQIALTALVLTLATRLGSAEAGDFGLGGTARRHDTPSRWRSLFDLAVLFAGLLFILSPFVAILVAGLKADLVRLLTEPAVLDALVTSLWVSLSSGTLAIFLSVAILLGVEALASAERRAVIASAIPRRGLEITASLVLVVPPVVLGAGWFLGLRQVTNVFAAAPYVVVLTNMAMAVPFAVRILGPALQDAHLRSEKLADSLGMSGLSRFRLLDWPALRRPMGLAFALSVAISLGDLGAIALFGNREFTTLPYLLYQRMGSYRTEDAAGLALILGVVCLALIWFAERSSSLGARS